MRRIAVGVVAALGLVAPASAEATTYCVQKPACVAAGGTDVPGPATGATIQNAITQAGGGDRIELGPVTFNDVNVTETDTVALAGDGIGRTVLVEGSVSNGTAVTWSNSGAVSDFTVNLPENTSTGIDARSQVNRVEVTAAPSVTAATGIQTEPGGTIGTDIHFSRVLLPNAPGNIAVRQVSTAHVQDSELRGEYGILVQDVGPGMQAARLRIQATNGIWVLANGFGYTLTDSIIRVVGAGFGVSATSSGTTAANASAFGITIVGDGTGGSAGVEVASGTGPGASLSLTDSVIDNVAEPLRCSDSSSMGTASSMSTDWSSYQHTSSSCSGTVTEGPNNLNPPPSPRFADPAGGDYHLRFDSPLIDRGQAVGSGGTDAFGATRYRDGNGDGSARVDIGGAEYQRLPPVVSATAPASGAAGAPLLFRATASDPDPGDPVSLRWSFDDGAALGGGSVSHSFAAPGARTATAVATDPTGLTARSSKTVQVLDKTAPRITGLRMVPSRFARGKRLVKISRRAHVGTSIRFRLTEAGRVRLKFERVRPGRKVGKRCLAPTRARAHRKRCKRYVAVKSRPSFSAKAGLNKIRFQGRLSRKRALKPGRYRLTLSARDPAGNQSKAARAAFTLLARR